ncbi:MAG: type VI secretion system baseplate subunit TssK [Gammaproteobacteria bacterium]|nr:type VI secretion system baseplate subunit TssK [Gammaproteobacteria bacterium]
MHWNNKVVWSVGMFLQPQHFQQHDRYLERLLEGRTQPLTGHAWGFVKLEVDEAALALGKIQLSSARGIMPDGTPFDFPAQDTPPTPLDIEPDTKDELIVLALPMRRPGTEEIDAGGDDDSSLARFSVDETDVADANTNSASGESTLIQVGQLRLTLLRQRDLTDAYCALGVVKISERRADNQVALNKNYIPPVLHVGSDPTLASYLQELHGLLHQRGDVLAARMTEPGRGGVAEIADFLLLQTVNRNELLFAHLSRHPLLHPERLYSNCLSLAGDLASFSHAKRRPPEIAEYRHDALELSFTPLLAEIRYSLNVPMERSAFSIELLDRRYGVKVASINDTELLKSASFVLAVNAQLPAQALRTRFPTQVKIGPVERIRDLVNLQLPGITLRALPVAPRQIPYHADMNYFELERDGDLWKQIQRNGALAMHVNGEFPGLQMEFWAIRN